MIEKSRLARYRPSRSCSPSPVAERSSPRRLPAELDRPDPVDGLRVVDRFADPARLVVDEGAVHAPPLGGVARVVGPSIVEVVRVAAGVCAAVPFAAAVFFAPAAFFGDPFVVPVLFGAAFFAPVCLVDVFSVAGLLVVGPGIASGRDAAPRVFALARAGGRLASGFVLAMLSSCPIMTADGPDGDGEPSPTERSPAAGVIGVARASEPGVGHPLSVRPSVRPLVR